MSELSSVGRSLPPVALVLLVGLIYATGRARLSSVSMTERGANVDGAKSPSRRGLWFYLGLAVLLVGLAPPLDSHTHRSLSAHMSQHVILMVIAPLFLVLADPWDSLVAGLPERVRKIGLRTRGTSVTLGASGAIAAPGHRRAGLATLSPATTDASARNSTERPATNSGWTGVAVAATVVQSVVMWGWHLPALYDLAVRTDGIHALEHLTFLGSGVWFWWAVGATGSRRNGIAALVVFIAALPGTALGAALILATHPWFPAYPDLQDQQVAGAIMWSIGGAVYLAGAVVLFISWLNRMDNEATNEPVISTPAATPNGIEVKEDVTRDRSPLTLRRT